MPIKMNSKKIRRLTWHYGTLSNYCVRLMERHTVRSVIGQVKDFQAKLDRAKTTEMVGESLVLQKISEEKLQKFLVNRMEAFFENGVAVLSSSHEFWVYYIKFGKRNTPDEVANIYTRGLAIHGPEYPEMWCCALSWAQKIKRTEVELFNLYQEARRYHPNSEDIYKAYFGVVLKEVGPTMIKHSTIRKMLAIYKSAEDNLNPRSALLDRLARYCNYYMRFAYRPT